MSEHVHVSRPSAVYTCATGPQQVTTPLQSMPTSPAIVTELAEVTERIDAPCRIFYKKETQQPSGSFKLRGMSQVVLNGLHEARAKGKALVHTFSSSGGNAGLAAAFASASHGVSCTVVLPETSKGAISKLERLGAKVLVYGSHWGEADAYLRGSIIPSVAESVHAIYCHPFDDATLCQGHASIVDEIVSQIQDSTGKNTIEPSLVKGIVCSCGGGGLYSGIVEGLKRHASWAHVPVLVVETSQTACFNQAVKQGQVVHLQKISTLATSLASPYVSQRAFDYYSSHDTRLCTVEDLDAVRATIYHYDTFHEITEPACGATLAVSTNRKDLLTKLGPLSKEDVVIFVECGGSTLSEKDLERYRELGETEN